MRRILPLLFIFLFLTNFLSAKTTFHAEDFWSVCASTPNVTITPSPNDTICQNATLILNGSASNGPIITWAWTVSPVGGVVFSPDTFSQNPTVTFTTAGSYTFTLFATNADPSTGSVTQVIEVLPMVTPTAAITGPIGVICGGANICFTVTPTNGGTAPGYQWDVNGVLTGNVTNSFCSSTLNNNDVVSCTVTSNAPCLTTNTVVASFTVSITPTVVSSVTVTPSPANACPGSSITFTATPINGGATPAYQWVLNGGNVGANTSTFTLSNIVGGEQVWVVLSSNATCITVPNVNSNTVTVTILASPTLTVTHGTATVCPTVADTLIVKGTAGATFSWAPAAGLNVTTNDTVIASNAGLGVHTYYVTATLGTCTHTDSVKVTVSNGLIATAGPNATICLGQSAPLSVTGGTTWSWTPVGNLSCTTCQNTIATPTATTTYTVITSMGACTNTVTETITVIPNASVSFNTTVITAGIPQTIGFTNTSSANSTGYFWTFGDNLSSVLQTPAPHTYNAVGTYSVALIAYGVNGCNDTLSTLIVVADSVGLIVPNIFTPNGDNINDVWQPGVHGVTSFECTIYDRWGLKVYEFAGAQDHWDGYTTGGLPCTNGTYYYILKANDRNNKAYDLKGFLQLIH